MRRNSESFRNSGAYTSPGTPEYNNNNVGEMPKTWSSERVPLPTSSTSSRRYVSSTALIPFNSGRALPSKWDDAERWITSPVSGYGPFKTSSIAQPQRRPKSKSGPLGPTGLVYLSNYSPTMPESGKMRNFMANSPLTTGVLVPDGLSVHYDAGKANSSLYDENSMMRCTSVPGLSDLLSETSGPSSQDDKLEGGEEEGVVSRVVSRRDMATQMSPEGSTHSSSKGRLSFSNLPSSIPTSVRTDGNHAMKDEIRDVQVDKGTTTARQSKKQGLRKMKKDSTNVEESPATWNVNEASKNTSKLQREEAKITAWENLQKAKAEAAIRKLEMKLEKKRSASMDKITNKLRAAQMKSRDMRDSLSDRAPTTSQRRISCCMRVRIHSLGSCFSRHRN
ncbi:hypothetical protein BUALT_Bualt04G0112100 [Buddleja alternifolia]|uniref:Remorin C-terminal domain-containing protein n=1 Tax=Buddleja alternifolia TaxID=168488 RepID=A0AAV6XSF9_9LAMI|nr:hypothetical protein BUALT_Bualt04G0112100 [Buddleja alternifolia]